MTVNKNNNLDKSKKSKSDFFLQDLLEFDKNIPIGFGLLIFALYLINKLTSSNISQDVQGFLVVIIGLLIIVAIDFLKKDTKTANSNLKLPYPKIENNYYYNYTGENIYHHTKNTNYSSKENLEEVAGEIKKIIDELSENTTDSDIKEMPVLEARIIKEIKQNDPEKAKDLTNRDLSIAAKTIENIEQDKSLKQRIVDAVKVAGTEAFMQSLNTIRSDPSSSIIIAAIQGWQSDDTDIKHQNENSE